MKKYKILTTNPVLFCCGNDVLLIKKGNTKDV